MLSEKGMRAVGLLRKTTLTIPQIAKKAGLSAMRVRQLDMEYGVRRTQGKPRLDARREQRENWDDAWPYSHTLFRESNRLLWRTGKPGRPKDS